MTIQIPKKGKAGTGKKGLSSLLFGALGNLRGIPGTPYFIKTPRKPRSVNGDEWWFRFGFRKLPVFREAVKPRLVGGDRSHGAISFTKEDLGSQHSTS
jgi:hypothetical protein